MSPTWDCGRPTLPDLRGSAETRAGSARLPFSSTLRGAHSNPNPSTRVALRFSRRPPCHWLRRARESNPPHRIIEIPGTRTPTWRRRWKSPPGADTPLGAGRRAGGGPWPKRNRYTRDFRPEAVRLLDGRGRSKPRTASGLGARRTCSGAGRLRWRIVGAQRPSPASATSRQPRERSGACGARTRNCGRSGTS